MASRTQISTPNPTATMQIKSVLILATAALTSASAIDKGGAAAPLKWDNMRIQFSHDYDCKWSKDGKVHTSVPKCNTKDYKHVSYMFDKGDESGKCFSPKDLNLLPGQENWHSYSFCLPPRVKEKGCSFHMFSNVHCEGLPIETVDSESPSLSSFMLYCADSPTLSQG